MPSGLVEARYTEMVPTGTTPTLIVSATLPTPATTRPTPDPVAVASPVAVTVMLAPSTEYMTGSVRSLPKASRMETRTCTVPPAVTWVSAGVAITRAGFPGLTVYRAVSAKPKVGTLTCTNPTPAEPENAITTPAVPIASVVSGAKVWKLGLARGATRTGKRVGPGVAIDSNLTVSPTASVPS